MFRNPSILLLFLVAVASCGKHAEKGKVFSTGSLVGKWEYTEHYFSIGGPGKWQPVQPGGQTIDFKPDATFTSAASFSANFQSYEIVDSTTVKFTPAPTAPGHVLMRYEINSAEGILLLHPIEPMCIEGCSYKFKRRDNR
jgi:hypothetical protein